MEAFGYSPALQYVHLLGSLHTKQFGSVQATHVLSVGDKYVKPLFRSQLVEESLQMPATLTFPGAQ